MATMEANCELLCKQELTAHVPVTAICVSDTIYRNNTFSMCKEAIKQNTMNCHVDITDGFGIHVILRLLPNILIGCSITNGKYL
jgi:hypothetical protein